MNKKEIRNKIRNKKRQYSPNQLGELSLSVLSRLSNDAHLLAAHTILMYYSLPDEVNTHLFINQLVEAGKQVLLPVVLNEQEMEIREYTGMQDLREGAFHIFEPIGKLFPKEKYPEIELGIIPGMSFDKEGNRLGRGKGYYDRFLQQVPNMYKIGICFDFQIYTDSIPVESTDIQMDQVIC